MKTGNVVLGILAGVAIGALAGILFAPDKGSKTRKQILEKGEGYADDLKQKFDELLNTVTEKYNQVKSETEDLADKAKAKYGSVAKDHMGVKNQATA